MKILFLAHRIPYPPNKGEKIRAYHELQHLSARHIIDLFCFSDSDEEAEQLEGLRKLCRRIYVEPRELAVVATGAIRSLVRGEPLSCGCFFSRKFQRHVWKAIETEGYDLIFVYCSYMAQYVPCPTPVPMVMDFVDIDSAKWAQYSERSRFPVSWFFAREARKLAQHEEKWARASSSTIVVTAIEAAQLKGEDLPHTEVIGNGVDIPPTPEDELPPNLRALQPYALFVGTMDYRPNVDAVEYFAKDILPRVREHHPALKFVVVGRDPSRRVRKLARLPGVIVTGTVPRVDGYLRGSSVVVAPFRVARGIQNKVLEALAAGKPVVATSASAAAIGAQHGETLLVADTPIAFAGAVIALIENHVLVGQFDKGPEFVRKNFSWRENMNLLEQVLERAAGLISADPMVLKCPN
jgi:sugar transferase (PEP-CTERM/EpsH1 system associated)